MNAPPLLEKHVTACGPIAKSTSVTARTTHLWQLRAAGDPCARVTLGVGGGGGGVLDCGELLCGGDEDVDEPGAEDAPDDDGEDDDALLDEPDDRAEGVAPSGGRWVWGTLFVLVAVGGCESGRPTGMVEV